jgi:hypothetical protein
MAAAAAEGVGAMSKYAVPVVVGFAVAFVIAFLIGLLNSRTGGSGLNPILVGGFVGAFTAYIMANLAGNRKVATASQDERDRALALTPPAGKALVCLYREGFVAKAAGLNVAVDGKEVAQLKSPRFTLVTVSPGQHQVTAAFGGLAGAQNVAASATVQLAEGEAAAVRFGVSMGLIKNTVTATPAADLAAVRQALANVPMSVPEVAEV